MIKRTLYFENPAYLRTKDEQLVFKNPRTNIEETIPIEDIGIVVLDNKQITVTHGVMEKLLSNNVALITCDSTHHPVGLMLNLNGNTLLTSKHRAQAVASVPLKKQLWQQTVKAKVQNQMLHLSKRDHKTGNLKSLLKEIRSGDPGNIEAQAAVHYWKNIFPVFPDFRRSREGAPPNNLLNYGYSIIRAMIARSLVGSGLLPSLGIFHRNQYNAYCLADDIMEPYRVFVDEAVYEIISLNGKQLYMTNKMKHVLLSLPSMDVKIKGEKSPMFVAAQKTSASLAKCFEGKADKIDYPLIY